MMDLYLKVRPRKFDNVIGQDQIVRMMKHWVTYHKIPHAILFIGPSGCGKTTLARILRHKVKCSRADCSEVNAAETKGIDLIRTIKNRMMLAPIEGESRIWIIDESHKLTSEAQGAFLKLLEDTPDHVYFFLCTTDPHKLLHTIRTRCTEVAVQLLDEGDLLRVMKRAIHSEHIQKMPDMVLDKIISCSNGSARKALVFLNQIRDMKSREDMMSTIQRASYEQDQIIICRALFNQKTKWKDMVEVLKEVRLDDPESIRWLVLAYATSVLKGGGWMAGRAFSVIQAFRDNWFDCKAAGLYSGCYEILMGSK